MSVIVIGMEMPECCLCCHLFAGNGCMATGKIFNDFFNVACRPDGCPLRPLPDGHGDLIDRDELLSRFRSFLWAGDFVLEALKKAYPIIEAEGGNAEDDQRRSDL